VTVFVKKLPPQLVCAARWLPLTESCARLAAIPSAKAMPSLPGTKQWCVEMEPWQDSYACATLDGVLPCSPHPSVVVALKTECHYASVTSCPQRETVSREGRANPTAWVGIQRAESWLIAVTQFGRGRQGL
jgi:hypothetical protein